MSWIDILIACASFAVALTAVRGRTWDDTKSGIAALTLVGWIAALAAVALLVLTLAKASADGREKDELRTQLTSIATNTMIGLTQELDRQNAGMRLIPRVALFPASNITAETPELKTGQPFDLAQAMVAGMGTVETGELGVRLFGDDSNFKRAFAKASPFLDPSSKLLALSAGRVNHPDHGPFAFNAIIQYTQERETAKVVQAIFDRKGELWIELRLRDVADRAAIEKGVRSKMGTGFGYLRLSKTSGPNLCFSLDPMDVVTKSTQPTVLRISWQIGVVGGIRAEGCPNLGS